MQIFFKQKLQFLTVRRAGVEPARPMAWHFKCHVYTVSPTAHVPAKGLEPLPTTS